MLIQSGHVSPFWGQLDETPRTAAELAGAFDDLHPPIANRDALVDGTLAASIAHVMSVDDMKTRILNPSATLADAATH